MLRAESYEFLELLVVFYTLRYSSSRAVIVAEANSEMMRSVLPHMMMRSDLPQFDSRCKLHHFDPLGRQGYYTVIPHTLKLDDSSITLTQVRTKN